MNPITIVLLLALLSPLGMANVAYAARPIHVCGIVTAYFVSDIALGGRIEIDGKNYPIASSASYRRTQPLPQVAVGSDVCLDGTVNDAGDLLDFTVTPRTSPSPAVPATATQAPGPDLSPWGWPLALAALALAAAGALVLARRER